MTAVSKRPTLSFYQLVTIIREWMIDTLLIPAITIVGITSKEQHVVYTWLFV